MSKKQVKPVKAVKPVSEVVELDLSVGLVDYNKEPYVKQDGSPLTMEDVVLAALAVSDPKHEDKLERAEAIDAVKSKTLSDEQLELIKKWVAKTVPSPVLCQQIIKAL